MKVQFTKREAASARVDYGRGRSMERQSGIYNVVVDGVVRGIAYNMMAGGWGGSKWIAALDGIGIVVSSTLKGLAPQIEKRVA